MAVRTVRVVLTGIVTPYTTAMRTAARTTASTAGRIGASMRTAAARSSAAMTAMARSAQAQAARAGASMQAMAARASAAMSTLAARATAATRGALAPVPGLAARAGAAFTTLGVRGAAAFSAVRASAARAAGVVGGVLPPAAVRAGAALTAAGARASAALTAAATRAGAAAAVIASRWSTAASAVASGWRATSAVISAAMGAAATAAGAGATWVAGRWTVAAAAVSARWSATGAAVAGAMATARATAGAAAGWVAARWTAAAASVAGAMSAMRLAAFAAGAGILGVANGGTKALTVLRNASLGLVAAFGLAAFAAARFDKAMSEVRAVTGGSARDMRMLSQAALEAGQSTIYSATQAAKAEAELARAGISTADIIGGALKGALDLAASGQLELGESAIISAQAMNAFKLEGADVGHIADVISAGAGKSATNVHDMGQAFRQAALLSSQTGLSLEQTVGSLSLFAQNALTGSDAGTSLKVMLQRLVPQSKEAAGTMDDIGFSAYDAQGNFIGLSALAGVMKTSFSKLTPEARNAAMATIFGSDAVRAATILYEAGTAGIDKWVGAVNDQGYATDVAATMTDNLSGDLERLKGALETALIGSGSTANNVLRNMATALTDVVNWYSRLSPGVQSSVTVMAGLVGVITLVGSGLLLMLPRIMAVRAELVALGVTAARVRASMMMLGRMGVVVAGLAAISWGVGKLMDQFKDAPPNVTKMANAMVDLAQKGKASGEMSRVFGENLDGIGEAAARLAHPGALDRIGDSLYEITHLGMDQDAGLEKARDQIKAIDEALAGLVQAGATKEAAENFKRFAAEAEKGGTSTDKFRTLLPGYTEALAAADTQNKLTASSQGELGEAASMTADDMADQRTEAEKLTDALAVLNGVAISAAEKEIAFRSSLADLTAAVKENGHSLDITSEKGRAVKSSFLGAAQAAMAHAEAVAEQSGSIEAGNAILEADIAVLKRTMHQAGFTDRQIRELTDAYTQLPGAAATKVTAPGAVRAAAELQTLRDKVMAVPPGKTITVKAPTAAAIRALEAAGYSVKKIPGTKNVKITAPTGTAIKNAQALQRELNKLKDKSIKITTYRETIALGNKSGKPRTGEGGSSKYARGGLVRSYATGGRIQGFPDGGSITGPGTGTSDSILARVSNGEFVVRAAAVRRYGAVMFEQLNAMRMPATGLAVGGLVSGRQYAATQSAPAAPAAGGEFVGDLYLSSGEFLGAVRGTVQPMIRDSEDRQAHRARTGRR